MACVNNILTALTLLRQKTDFSDDNIKKNQDNFDEFFQKWVQLWGKKIISNLTHTRVRVEMHLIFYSFGETYASILNKAGKI